MNTDPGRLVDSKDETALWYRGFAELETPGHSAIYEHWARGVAADDEIVELLDTLPLQKRQPNLIFAAARLLGAAEGGYDGFRQFLLANWTAIAIEARARSTQTNEARRCASLLPALSLITGPLALLEVGASAGLCLFPDRYSYCYDGGVQIDPHDGPSNVLLTSTTTGAMPIVNALPDVAWRAGLDLNPLDVRNQADLRWLETLVWPEQQQRRDRLRAAIAIAQADPPRIVRADANEGLRPLASEAPDDATLVIITSAVLVYLPFTARMQFVETVLALMRERNAHWVSLEGFRGLPGVREALPADGGEDGRFVLALDQKPLAYTGPHGQSLDWL